VDGTAGLLFQDIGVGSFHSCALSVEGNVYCWGWNGDGQLGVGESFGSYYSDHKGEALQLPIARGQELTVGGDSGCVIDEERVLWCWGVNGYGELGDGVVDHGDACFHPNFDDCSASPVRVVLPEFE
jgi:alpha-tubulin suppressor-like RCC1 family protein